MGLFCIYWNWGFPLSIIVSMALGFLWYGPFFNDVWIEYSRFSARSAKRWQQTGHDNDAIIKTFCAFVMMATIVQYLVYATNSKTVLSGLYLGALLWIGFAFPLRMTHYARAPKKKKVIALLDLTFQLSYFLIQSSIMAHFTRTYSDNTE